MVKINYQAILDEALNLSLENKEGYVVSYIPELACVDPEQTAASIYLPDDNCFQSGNSDAIFTLQSAAKLVVLIGLMEEVGEEQVLSWINVEPSGQSYASLARLEGVGPMPSNPMVNAGAIALCDKIFSITNQPMEWLNIWIEKLFGSRLKVNHSVYRSECKTGDRNRAIAYLLKSSGVIRGNVEDALEVYFTLCSYDASIQEAAYFPMLLSNKGFSPKGQSIISSKTTSHVISLMATCGLYDESGIHLWKVGLPSKSAVSGLILACSPKNGGIAAWSPRINSKGTSYRARIILEYLSEKLHWHFAGN